MFSTCSLFDPTVPWSLRRAPLQALQFPLPALSSDARGETAAPSCVMDGESNRAEEKGAEEDHRAALPWRADRREVRKLLTRLGETTPRPDEETGEGLKIR